MFSCAFQLTPFLHSTPLHYSNRRDSLHYSQTPKVQVYVASISKKGDEILPKRMAVASELWKANISAEFEMNQSDPNLFGAAQAVLTSQKKQLIQEEKND